MAASERAPLLPDAAGDSAFSALVDAEHGIDPNESTFMPHPQARVERSLAQIIVVLGAMWIGTFLAALDGTIVATIFGTVGSEFSVSKSVGWLGTSYLVTQTAFQPLYGRMSDIFGRKPATLFASGVFLGGTLLCGLARSFSGLCAARAVAGIGGGGLTSMSTIVTSDLVSLKMRGTWQGLGNVVFAAGAALGGPLGGLLADRGSSWRLAFLVQVPLGILHFAVVSRKVDIPAGPGRVVDKLRRIDVLGALTLVGAVSALLVGLSLGGNELPWEHPVVLGALVGALVLAFAFVFVEDRVAREPIMPLALMRERTPACVALTCLFISITVFSVLFNVPLYFTTVLQRLPSSAGLHLIPNALGASTFSLGSGIFMARTGTYRTLVLVCGIGGFVGPAMMFLWTRGVTHEAFLWATMPWAGAALGTILTVTLVALIGSVDPHEMAAATGMSYLFRAIGSVLGISLSNALLQNALRRALYAAGLPPSVAEAIRSDAHVLRELTGPTLDAALGAYNHAMGQVFLFTTVCGVLAYLCLVPIEEKPLPGHQPHRA